MSSPIGKLSLALVCGQLCQPSQIQEELPVRDKLQLAAGDQLELESVDDRIMLRPLRGTARLRKNAAWESSIAVNRCRPRRFSKQSNRYGVRGTSRS
jgi:hypothetical protein